MVGRFPFCGPWWKVKVKVKRVGSKYFLRGYPSYYLQTDTEENQKAIISLFFRECFVPVLFQDEFFKWLPEQLSLNFAHLEDTLKTFKESKLRGQTSADTQTFDIFHHIKNSGKYEHVQYNCLLMYCITLFADCGGG